MRRRPSTSTSEEDTTQQRTPPVVARHDKTVKNSRQGIGHEGHAKTHHKDRQKGNAPRSRPSDDQSQPHTTSTTSLPSPQMEKKSERPTPLARDITSDSMVEGQGKRCSRLRNPWAISLLTVVTTLLGFGLLFLIVQSFMTRQLDVKGCGMSYMRPSFTRYSDFDTEHTRFASKYTLYLYREGGIDEDSRVKGVPVLFIPGNAGSYKQVRSLAAEAAYHYHNVLQHDLGASRAGKRPLDFFTVDFNEDITAFHGQTLLDQAEYLNDAISFILSLYHTPSRSIRDTNLPDPTSVIIVGHSMGGIVARTMLTMPNYQANSINTIVTLSAPHARPPVSFDGDIVRTYKTINDFWRHAYSQKWAIDNPLWHVTLISIAGGGLDTVVPSDYASLASLVPETHGFTVFTSSIPYVWTGMDHLAITWCDQVRKSIVRSLYDVIDVSRPTQTLPRAERMRGFKKWFLTGLEDIAEKTLPHKEPMTLLTLEDHINAIVPQGERLVLRNLGRSSKKPKAYLLPVPPQDSEEGRKFTLLTNERLDSPGEHGNVEVLFCSIFPLQAGQSAALFSMNMDLSGDSSGSTRLACKNAASDTIALPASTRQSSQPFQMDEQPFSYLQYSLEDLVEHQFIAVVDKASEHSTGWIIAEFSTVSESVHRADISLEGLLTTGLNIQLPPRRPLMMDIKLPALQSSLLAYKLHLSKRACNVGELFSPLVRQYISDVYESKFFVNVENANVNLHGVAPYMPSPLFAKHSQNGLSLQIWSDPTCQNAVEVSLNVDILGSLGKLWMRYRLVFAAFPLLIVALVLRQQFTVYNDTGVFMSFGEGLNECLRSSIPLAFLTLTCLSIALAGARHHATAADTWLVNAAVNVISPLSYAAEELLLGSEDTFFWFLVPLFGAMSVGICVAINYAALTVTYVLSTLYYTIRSVSSRSEDSQRTPASFAVTSTRKRIFTTGILLSLVSTILPYQFAYMVLCIVHIATNVRAFRLARESQLDTNYSFSNYTHSILILMIWILPINLPVLVVWIRNLAVHWMTPFSSHHNILSILPFTLFIETLSVGRMVPRVQSSFRVFTGLILLFIASFAAIYGVTYAFVLHHLANFLCAWLASIHFDVWSFSPNRIGSMIRAANPQGNVKKRP